MYTLNDIKERKKKLNRTHALIFCLRFLGVQKKNYVEILFS